MSVLQRHVLLFLLRFALFRSRFAMLCSDFGVMLLRYAAIWRHFATFCSDWGLFLLRSAAIWMPVFPCLRPPALQWFPAFVTPRPAE